VEASKRSGSGVPKLVGLWALLAWAHGLFNIWPLPPRSEVLSIQLQWSLWWESLAFVILGVTAAFLAFRAIRYWWVAVLLTSGAWLAGSIPHMIGDILNAGSLREWFAPFYDTMKPSSLYFIFIVPLYHIVLMCAAVIYGVAAIAGRFRADAAVA
jgi:hypothetical protein